MGGAGRQHGFDLPEWLDAERLIGGIRGSWVAGRWPRAADQGT